MKADQTVLKQQIENARKMSANNSIVTYDLTEGVDFSDPKMTAEALADVFFQKDAVNWFKVKDDDLDFKPNYKSRIILKQDDHHRIKKTFKDFISDLKSEEIDKLYSKQVEYNARPDDPGYIMAGGISLYFWERSQHRYRKKVYLEKIVNEFQSNLEVIES